MLQFSDFTKWTIIPGLLTIIGCSDAVKPPIIPRNDPYSREQIHITDDDLRSHTAVQTPMLTRDDAGLLFVNLPIRAATNLKLYVDYRVTWFDRNHDVLSQTSWMHKTLPPNVPDQITFNSTTPRVVDFQIDLRYSE